MRVDEANKLKKLVNELCREAEVGIRYPNISEAGNISAIRADQFYGLPLMAAIRSYLEIRKSSGLGAATAVDIYRAIKDGGYKFDTKNEDNARIGVGNTLRKSSSVFHRLPNGQYGLLSWYPSAKAPEDANAPKPSRRGHKSPKKEKSKGPKISKESKELLTNQEVRDVILAQQGNFQGADIEQTLKEKFPNKVVVDNKVSTVIFRLKAKGLVKVVSERSGKKGATFAVAG